MTYGDYPDLSKVQRILVIKLRHLGDVLLSSPVFSALKEAMPSAKIDALVYLQSKEMLEGHEAIDQIYCYDQSAKKGSFYQRLKEELSLLLKIRRQKYDLVFNLTEGDRGAFIGRISKARYRVGVQRKKKGLFGKTYTHEVKQCGKERHVVEMDLDAVRCIGVFPQKRELSFHIPQVTQEKISQFLKMNQIDEFLLIHPAARWKFKCLPVEMVRKMIAFIENQGKKVIVTCSNDPIEKEMVAQIISGFNEKNVFSLSGTISLKELGSLMQYSKGLVCVDSVPLHMSSSLKVPVLVFFGPTSEVKWGPWKNEKAIVMKKDLSCRPCFLDGCGGSKMSDCLYTFPLHLAMDGLKRLLNIR